MMKTVSLRNHSIDIIRYFCAILVVTIHTAPFRQSCYGAYYVLTQFIARIGVPFFFAVSGYYFFQKLEKGNLRFWKFLFEILKKYLIWSMIYYAVLFVEGGCYHLPEFLKTCVLDFFIYGSYYHFWYFPALIYSSCAAYLMYKIGLRKGMLLISLALFAIGCMGCAYSGLFDSVTRLKVLFASSTFKLARRIVLTGVPFFVCGYLILKIQQREPKYLTGTNCKWALAGAVTLWVCEFLVLHIMKWNGHMSISLGMYPVVVTLIHTALQYPLPSYQNLSEKCRVLAGFTYYAHPLVILYLEKASTKIYWTAYGVPMFLVTMLVTLTGGLLIWKCRNKYLTVLAS